MTFYCNFDWFLLGFFFLFRKVCTNLILFSILTVDPSENSRQSFFYLFSYLYKCSYLHVRRPLLKVCPGPMNLTERETSKSCRLSKSRFNDFQSDYITESIPKFNTMEYINVLKQAQYDLICKDVFIALRDS